MDICLIETDSGTHLRPNSVLGMLWLQTHFENEHWDALANRDISIPSQEATVLYQDAQQAGLEVACLPTFSKAK